MHFDPKSVSPIAVWEITLKCNLNCLHCGSSAGKARPNELTTKEALDLCEDLADTNVDEVCLMGGEPLLRKDWFDIGKKVRDLGMRLDIITNGFHKNKEEIIAKLVKLDPFAVAVSIDGATAKTHDTIRRARSFKAAKEFLFAAKEANLPCTVVTTVNKINYKELPGIRDFILGKDVAWQIQTASPLGRFSKKYALSEEEFYAVGLFIASIKKKSPKKKVPVIGAHDLGYNSIFIPCLGLYSEWRGCPAGLCAFGIQSDGGIKGCLATPDSLIEGNIRKQSIKDIWNNPNSFKYNRQFNEKNLGEYCQNCKHGKTCRGGCISKSTSLTGKLHNDPWCFFRIEKKLEENGKDPKTLLNKIL